MRVMRERRMVLSREGQGACRFFTYSPALFRQISRDMVEGETLEVQAPEGDRWWVVTKTVKK